MSDRDPRIELGVVGPRRVGGRYLCGYWQKEYTVTAIEYQDSTGTHGTAWDKKDDRVIAHPTTKTWR
jgi:hypothetical protein